MKIKDGFVMKQVAGLSFVVPVGGTKLDSYMTLNETGVFLFERLKDGSDIPALTAALCAEYDVSPETAEKDAEAFVCALREAGVLDEQ